MRVLRTNRPLTVLVLLQYSGDAETRVTDLTRLVTGSILLFGSVQTSPVQFMCCEQTQGRLNQWAHWARAQGPRIFFLFEGPPTGCGEINV